MSNGRKTEPFPEAFLTEIADELQSLEGEALDQFLANIGMDPGQLLAESDAARVAALSTQGRQRLEDARARVKKRGTESTAAVFSFDIAKKRAVLEAIRVRGEKTGEMTIAARNQKIDSDTDLDSLLEACLKLGVIDEHGELKD
jgi:hypothetical protein